MKTEECIIKEALIEADKGNFISDEQMTRWISSWGTENELPAPKADIVLKTEKSVL